MAVGKELFKLYGLIGMQGVEVVEKDLKKIDKQARRTQKEIDRLGRKVSDVGKVFTKAFTIPLAIAGGALIKFGADFDRAMTRSTAIMGNLSEDMKKQMRTAAIDVSKVTKASAKEAAEAYFFLASAGLNAAQSIGALPLVARFAQAGAFDLARATDLLTDAQSALGLSSKDTETSLKNMNRVSDVLVKANTLANATVEQFSESLTNKAGAALRILGKDIEEGAAVLAVFADQGLKGAGAGEALNIALRDLQKSSIQNRAAFNAAKISVFDTSGEMRNMADIVGELERHLSGMSDEQKRAALMTLGFQEKSINATMALIGTSKAIRDYEKNLREAAGTTTEVAEKQLKNFWDRLGLIKDRIIAVGLTLWDSFGSVLNTSIIPLLERMTGLLERAADWWKDLDAAGRRTVGGFVLIAAAIGPVVFLIGKLIALSKIFIPLLVALRTGTLSWSGAMGALSKSVLGITIVIAALVALGWYWYSQWDTLSVQLKALWAKIKLFFIKGMNGIVQSLTDGMLSLMDLVLKVSSVVPGLTEKITAAKIGILKFKAALLRMEGDQRTYTNNLNSQAEANESLTTTLKKAIAAGKEAIGIKNKSTAATKKQIEAYKEEMDAHVRLWEIAKEIGKKRVAFDEKIQKQLDEMTLSKQAKLQLEREQALIEAEKLGADKFNVLRLYALKEQQLREETRKAEAQKDKDDLIRRLHTATSLGNKLDNVLGRFSDNKIKRLDNEAQKQIAAINNSQMTEEKKQLAIQKIESETEARRQKLERQR